MQENKNLVEEALIQMKNVEDVIAENAKGILASTMKEEISQLVKESLSEQEELDVDVDTDVDDTKVDNLSNDSDDESSDDDDDELSDDDDDITLPMDDETPIDIRHIDDEKELLKVFKAMGEDDGIIVMKDGDDIHLKDNETDEEYLVKLGESEEENYETMEYNEEVSDDKVQQVIDAIFSDEPLSSDLDSDTEDEVEMDDEVVYEIEFNEESDEEEIDESDDGLEESEEEEMDESEEEEMDESEDEEMYESEEEEMDESEDEEMYESEEEEMDEAEEEEMDEAEEDEGWHMNETYSHKKTKKVETKEGKMSVKAKGVKGHGPKFSYKEVKGGFDEHKKEGPKSVGTGSVKKAKSFPKGENTDGKNKIVGKKSEAKEASRTYGMGSKEGRGLRKGITPNRNLTFENLESEVKMLREKNEEYRKALNVFREKLNEVAIFNSNLAYATRLFTEHSTTKKEKINILRRFDNVQTLKESKTLYKSIKDELNQTETKSLNETVENKLVQSVHTGSSTTLIENKTYENPQFLRIRDLISKVR